MGTNYNKLRPANSERQGLRGSRLQRQGGKAVALLAVAAAAAGCAQAARATNATDVKKGPAAGASANPGTTTPKPEQSAAGAYDLSRAPVVGAKLCELPAINQKLGAFLAKRLAGATNVTASGCTDPTPSVPATSWTVGYTTEFGINTSSQFQVSAGRNETQLQGPATLPGALRGANVVLSFSSPGNVYVLTGPASADANSQYYLETDGVPGINKDGSQLSFDVNQAEIAADGQETVAFLGSSGILAAEFPAK